jgi:ribosomal protein S18 acetylase RimI-like enzyme
MLPKHLSELEYLRFDQVEEAAGLMADAFLHWPTYCFIYEGMEDEERRKALKWLFIKNLTLQLQNESAVSGMARCAFVRKPGQPPKMVCFFLLATPAMDNYISAWTILKTGILWFPLKFGFQSFRRLLQADSEVKALKKRFLDAQGENLRDRNRYCTLERMTVHPSMQGRGVGSHYLRLALEEVRRDYGCLLQTRKEINVSFYSKLGFQVANKEEPAPWLMVVLPPEERAVIPLGNTQTKELCSMDNDSASNEGDDSV